VNGFWLKWLFVMVPAFFINEALDFATAMIWVLACWMILLAVPRRTQR
jgi:hypothetical protein